MADNDILVESVEVALLSDVEMSSAIMMKDAYLPHSVEKTDDNRDVPPSKSKDSSHEDKTAGPNVLVYISKISNRTSPEEIEKFFMQRKRTERNIKETIIRWNNREAIDGIVSLINS